MFLAQLCFKRYRLVTDGLTDGIAIAITRYSTYTKFFWRVSVWDQRRGISLPSSDKLAGTIPVKVGVWVGMH